MNTIFSIQFVLLLSLSLSAFSCHDSQKRNSKFESMYRVSSYQMMIWIFSFQWQIDFNEIYAFEWFTFISHCISWTWWNAADTFNVQYEKKEWSYFSLQRFLYLYSFSAPSLSLGETKRPNKKHMRHPFG